MRREVAQAFQPRDAEDELEYQPDLRRSLETWPFLGALVRGLLTSVIVEDDHGVVLRQVGFTADWNAWKRENEQGIDRKYHVFGFNGGHLGQTLLSYIERPEPFNLFRPSSWHFQEVKGQEVGSLLVHLRNRGLLPGYVVQVDHRPRRLFSYFESDLFWGNEHPSLRFAEEETKLVLYKLPRPLGRRFTRPRLVTVNV